ncbi:16S rRNA (uracil(1498)-N(3))-methyltransferase [Ectothiorhodospira mobilis]|uniref:Ribosomal RNA small subunit methyltransferase E n=1 Tax=Ectothiorhodospira mobilis TaxID=195064 RepID=A0A1I4SES6_ECTMO|nr:16S rRNA (uracil(1498)-N(3))-methyltransferase [Ectothiorhodospira mobilis]MCG5534762.1 16S rRNA (uracil(1498)-N(3))-methyltransferase [Ectothiorhodospira mobilis]SFM62998.1 16S rRNA m(3)U-1498 methyltransferase [Ectothiorhodospira mobilis]
MRIPRCFLPHTLKPGEEIPLDERAHRHVVQVLRLRPGAPLVLFNGEGGEYEATLCAAGRRDSRVRVERHHPRDTRPALPVTLVQGLAKGDRMDYSLQKATELGVTRIQPVITRRSVTSDDPRRLEKRTAHWRGVVLSACEQSGRNDLPTVAEPMPLARWLEGQDAAAEDSLHIVLSPEAPTGLRGLHPRPTAVTLLIGPEGGLEEAEIGQAVHTGFTPVRLGPRVLRTETAGVAALAVIQALWGDLGD